MEIRREMLETAAVDREKLASNFADVIPDCSGASVDVKTRIIDSFPLVNWLLNTSFTQRVRRDIRENGICLEHKDEDGNWVIEMPRAAWTLPITSDAADCCWPPFDFAKCAGNVPLKLLCLKDCQPIMDTLIGSTVTVRPGLEGVSRSGETLAEIRRRINRLSMAFLSARNIVLGMTEMSAGSLKPFHGVMDIVNNPAVATIDGTYVLAAFDSFACRRALLGGGEFVFALNPILYESLEAIIRPGQYGNLPEGWSRGADGKLRFAGVRFIEDPFVPVDVEAGTGEVWVLNSEVVGLYMGTDLLVADQFIKESGHMAAALEDGCGSDCTYYYNYGAALNNNATKVMRIVDVPISGNCALSTADLAQLLMPETLIPNI